MSLKAFPGRPARSILGMVKMTIWRGLVPANNAISEDSSMKKTPGEAIHVIRCTENDLAFSTISPIRRNTNNSG